MREALCFHKVESLKDLSDVEPNQVVAEGGRVQIVEKLAVDHQLLDDVDYGMVGTVLFGEDTVGVEIDDTYNVGVLTRKKRIDLLRKVGHLSLGH